MLFCAQGRIHQLEGTLLQQLEHSSRNTLKTADEASVGAKLDALLSPELLAAVAAVQPPAGSSGGGSSSSSVLLEELVGNNNQVCWGACARAHVVGCVENRRMPGCVHVCSYGKRCAAVTAGARFCSQLWSASLHPALRLL